MNHIKNKIQATYGYSDYEVKLIQYTLTALFYDFSKLIIFGIYYYLTSRFVEFLFSLIPLLLLRTQNGGIHFRKYWSCFIFTFVYLEACTTALPRLVSFTPLVMFFVLFLCAITNWVLGPKLPDRLKTANISIIRKAKCRTLLTIVGIIILTAIRPSSTHLASSFWTVVLHTIQLGISKIMEIKYHEKSH